MRGFVLLSLVAAQLAFAGTIHAQEGTPNGEAPAFDAEATEARRVEITALLESLRGRSEQPAVAARIAELERIEERWARVLDEYQRVQDTESQIEAAKAALAVPETEGLGHPPPYSIIEYDATLDAMNAAAVGLEESSEAARTSASALEAARNALDEAERAGRAADAAESEASELTIELAKAKLALRRLQVRAKRATIQLNELQHERSSALLEWLAPRVVPAADEYENRIAQLDERAALLVQRREQAELRAESARRRWERTAPDGSRTLVGELGALQAELAARQKEVALLGEQIERLDRARELVRRRFALFGKERPPRDELKKWAGEGRESQASLAREMNLARAEQSAVTREIERLASETPDPSLERHLAALRETNASYAEYLASLGEADQQEARLLEKLDRQLLSVNFAERLAELRNTAGDVWAFEVTSSEDRSITVGRIVIGLLGMLVGVILARIFTYRVGARVFSRMGIDEGAAHAYQSLAYYALLAVVFLIALRVVDIPLTAFAVAGGALAIGVGFGSQNIVNNFISGVILLAERPIKKGDLVQLEETYGNIEAIGLRSTRVRTGENIHVIVPNSAFLETRVINWTLNDPQVRIKVSVGVIYGSPTRDVERIINEVLADHPKVFESPKPIVIFKNFGDNSLDFEAHFWVRVRHQMERQIIESDIRYALDERFREANIVIAFPQRDIHLDATAPIPVVLSQGPPAGREDT